MLREIVSNEWFTILLLISVVLIAAAKLAFTTRFVDFLTLVGNSRYLKIYSRDQKFIDLFDGLLFLNLIISMSLFTMVCIRHLSDDLTNELGLFAKIGIGIGAILLIKILLERLLGSLFEIDELIDSYLFQKISYRNYLGLILVPINALVLYAIVPSNSVIFIVILLLMFINVIGIVTSFKSHQKSLINNIFYFILYLCALEISPSIILYKWIMNELGILEK